MTARLFVYGLVPLVMAATGCGAGPADRSITLATTTSAEDSGLLDLLVPRFRERTGIDVKVVAVGSGQALEMGRRGDADLLLTHAPDAERQFVDEGYGIERRPLMYNDFVLVGPKSDPADVAGTSSIVAAFAKIAGSESPFVSRGDGSGTHVKEQHIWQQSEITPAGAWYVRGGSGMALTLRLADEKNAYTLSDRGTFLAQRENLHLAILAQGDPLLKNQYSVMLVNPQRHPHVQLEAARQFAGFLLSPETQTTIGEFGKRRHGEPLFHPGEASDAVESTSRAGAATD